MVRGSAGEANDEDLDRFARIALVTRALTNSIDVEELVEVVVRQGMAGLHADGAVLTLLGAEGVLTPVAQYGSARATVEAVGTLHVGRDLPIAVAVRERRAVWVSSRDEAVEQFPALTDVSPTLQAIAAVPLIAGGSVLGGLGVNFVAPRGFSPDERMFIGTLADLTAMTLAGHGAEALLRRHAADPGATERSGAEREAIASLERLGLRAYGVTFTLAGMLRANAFDPRMGERMHEAITELDGITRDVRNAATTLLLRDDGDPSHPRFEALVTHGRDLVTVTDAERRLVYASPSFRDLLGEDPDAHLGRPVWELVHPDDRPRLGVIFADISNRPGESVTFECRLAHADGSWRRVEVHQVNRLDDPAVRGFVGNTRDVTARVSFAEQLAHQAMHDPLTGLPNRALLLDRLEHALARRGPGPRCTVLFMDIDRFKVVNDAHGHTVGDAVLKATAERLTRSVRPGDTVARLGGDEFVAIIDGDVPDDELAALVERLRSAAAEPVEVAGRSLSVALSVGAVRADGSTAQELLDGADDAMYAAKAANRPDPNGGVSAVGAPSPG